MQVEDQMSCLKNEVSKLQYRVAELEGHIYKLQQDDSLIKDVLQERIRVDNLSSQSCSNYQWSLVLHPKTVDQNVKELDCVERLNPSRQGSSSSTDLEAAKLLAGMNRDEH